MTRREMVSGEKRLDFTRMALAFGLGAALLSAAARADDPPPPAWFYDYDWQNLVYDRKFVSPLEFRSRITSHHGLRQAPLEGASEWHGAVDLEAPEGSPVFAAYPGIVVSTAEGRERALPEQLRFLKSRANPVWVLKQIKANPRWKPETKGPFDVGCGNYVIQGILPSWNPKKVYYVNGTQGDWDWGGFILYCHLRKVIQPLWTAVRVTDMLAESGNTGKTTGPHLHVAIYLDPKHLPKQLKRDCTPREGSGRFEGTCPVNPQRYLFQRSPAPPVRRSFNTMR